MHHVEFCTELASKIESLSEHGVVQLKGYELTK